mmetsp:Transcript_304/g.759  ORF Transcript_304/g.759 Transcript_304/m.759 type:complete len:126 (-) Transcript_304:2975-3352(-)
MHQAYSIMQLYLVSKTAISYSTFPINSCENSSCLRIISTSQELFIVVYLPSFWIRFELLQKPSNSSSSSGKGALAAARHCCWSSLSCISGVICISGGETAGASTRYSELSLANFRANHRKGFSKL